MQKTARTSSPDRNENPVIAKSQIFQRIASLCSQ